MDCSLSVPSIHGIFQARILEWVAISYSRGSSQPRDWTHISWVSCIGRWILYHLSYQWNPQTELNSTIKEHTPGWSEIHICDAGWFDICRLINVIITNDRIKSKHWGFPSGTNSKQTTCQCRRLKRCRFNPWVRKTPWSRKQQTIPVFLPGKFHGQRSLASYSPRGGKESDMT